MASLINDWNLENAPIDLFIVLDVTGNVNGTKLTLLKKVMCLVKENLRPFNQLTIVTFSSVPHRSFLLMVYPTRELEVILAINIKSLNCRIKKGLKMGDHVLQERHE